MPNAARTRIREVALEEFIRNGYPGAKIARIAKQAKVAPGRIYELFVDKDGLFRAVIASFIETGHTDLEVAGADPLLDLRTLAVRMAERQCRPEQLNGVRLIIANEHRLTEENRAGIILDREARRRAFAAAADRAMEAQMLRPMDPVGLATNLIGAVTAYFLMRLLLNPQEEPREAPGAHVDRMLLCWTTAKGEVHLRGLEAGLMGQK